VSSSACLYSSRSCLYFQYMFVECKRRSRYYGKSIGTKNLRKSNMVSEPRVEAK
jgi:hypothetical protein